MEKFIDAYGKNYIYNENKELAQKIEAKRKMYKSCYITIDNTLYIHIYDTVHNQYYVFDTDIKMKKYIDLLKQKRLL